MDRNTIWIALEDTMTAEHIAYEATPEFRAYWAAVEEEIRLYSLASWHNVKSPEFKAYRAQREIVFTLLDKCRALPEHLAAFGW